MAYIIEVMSLGEDLYPSLQAAANALNGVQQEFQFRVTAGLARQSGLSFQRADYSTAEIWDFLRRNRKDFGGNRPFIIAFVNAPLASSEYSNIFGSHEASEGLAVVTLHGYTQFVSDGKRFCCYYFIRYALSFVEPTLKSHNDPARKDCYFHKKLFKPDLRASMDTGHICDACMKELGKRLSPEEHEALKQMLAVVSGQYPYALVMKGGGVKGLAFAGALLEIEKYFSFDIFVGTSAGAITAVLLAADHSPSELEAIFFAKNFRDFLDGSVFKIPFNLLLKSGCYPGEHFRLWLAKLLAAKIPQLSEIKMLDLPNDAVIYACRPGSGTVVFDSRNERRDTSAAFATRCSMSIPVFFFPTQIDGRRVYDGGLRNNFPVTRFLADNPQKPFIALYLGRRDEHVGRRWLGSEIFDIWIEGEESAVVDSHADSVVVIDTSPIGSIDFRMQQFEKEFLLKVGRAAALRFLQKRKLDGGPDDAAVEAAHKEAEDARSGVIRMRRWRRVRRILLGLAILVAIYFLLPRFSALVSFLWRLIRRNT